MSKPDAYPYKQTCGICESDKQIVHGWLECPHCDKPCSKGVSCTICRQGQKGLKDVT